MWSIWHGTRPRPAYRTLLHSITSKDRDTPFIHLQDCPGLLLIYEVVPIDPPPLPWLPWTGSVCCLCSPVTGWSSRWGGFVWPWVVRHTPPLILPSESLQRTMANICEPPKCSIRKKRPVGWECVCLCVWGGLERCWILKLRWIRRSGAMCLRMSVSHQRLGYVSWFANGLGVMSPVLEIALTPFSAWGLIEFAHAHTGTNTQASYSHGSYVSSSETSSLDHTVSPTWCSFKSPITSSFQICMEACVCVYSFCSFPPIAINNEGVTRSMWPCKIQHNAASVTDEVIAGLLQVLQVNAISIHVKRQVWSQPSRRDEVSHEVGGGKQPTI